MRAIESAAKAAKGEIMNLKWLAITVMFFVALPVKAQNLLPDASKTPAQSLNNDKEKMSYVIGVNQAKNFKKDLSEIKLDLDADLVLKGFRDAFSGSGYLMTEDDMGAILIEINKALKTKQEEELKRSKEEAAKFLAANKSKPGINVTASGLQYQKIAEGNGPKPTDNDTVEVSYKGTLANGTKFEDTEERGKPAELPIAKISFAGLKEGLKLMPAGSKWLLFIPPALGAGERELRIGSLAIPPNSVLIFEIELLSIKPR